MIPCPTKVHFQIADWASAREVAVLSHFLNNMGATTSSIEETKDPDIARLCVASCDSLSVGLEAANILRNYACVEFVGIRPPWTPSGGN